MKSLYLRIGQVNAVWPGFIQLQRTESCLSLYSLSWSRNLSQSMEREGLLAYCVHENCTLSWTSWIQPSLTLFKSLRSFLMLLSSLCACLPNHHIISRFPNEIWCTFITAYYMQRPSLLKFMSLNELVAVALLPSLVISGVINSQLNCMTEYVHKQNTFFYVKSRSGIAASQSEILTWIVFKCSEMIQLNRQHELKTWSCLIDKSSIYFYCYIASYDSVKTLWEIMKCFAVPFS
jgi:hypothetical protein